MLSLSRAARATGFALVTLTLFAVPAQALLVFQGTVPDVLDPNNEAVYFTETAIAGGGFYTITNNTAASENAGLTGVGISNSDSIAFIESLGSTFGCDGNSTNSWCYAAITLDEFNWDTEVLDFDSGATGFDLFGDISNVLDPGDDTINYYQAADGELLSGDTWDGFYFGNAELSSQMFVILGGGAFVGMGGQPVPEPVAGFLMLIGLGGLAAYGSRA